MPKKAPRASSAKVASTAGRVLRNPKSTKAQKSAAASALSQRGSGKITKGDSVFKIIGLGKSRVPGGLSKKKH
jgi:hypothetical protein